MNEQLTELQKKIEKLKEKKDSSFQNSGARGYGVAVTMMTELISCIFVGMAIGLFLQKILGTSVLLTAFLTLLGGIAGLWGVVRFALNQNKGNKK